MSTIHTAMGLAQEDVGMIRILWVAWRSTRSITGTPKSACVLGRGDREGITNIARRGLSDPRVQEIGVEDVGVHV